MSTALASNLLGRKFGAYNAPVSSVSYDTDAAAYFATASVSDLTAKTNISAWATLLKAQGVWSNCVSYLFKSTENASSTTTAYSLGGAGTYNGSVSGSPTWGADGIVFSGSQVVSNALLNFTAATVPFTIISVITNYNINSGTGVIAGSVAVSGSNNGSYVLIAGFANNQLNTGSSQVGQSTSGIVLTAGNKYLATDIVAAGIPASQPSSTVSSALYLNGVSKGSVGTGGGITSRVGLSIGQNLTGGGDGFNGTLGEVHIFVGVALNSTQRAAVESFLNSKYTIF